MAESGIAGKYELLERLREGGMGAIYKVRHRLLDEIRVIKVMKPQVASDPALQARFLREARAAIKLRHPNIAQLFDFSVDDDGTAYIVLEYIDGLNLAELIERSGTPPVPMALEIARQSLKAVGYLHRQGFVHRDISPDNLMLTQDADGAPLVKLIDLGIARPLAESRMTETGLFMGKLRYASPERFEGGGSGAAGDPRSDLYSLGIVFYELLTGQSPIAGKDVSSIIAGHIFRPPRDFSETDPGGRVPAALRMAILKAMAKRPEQRFATAEEFALTLKMVQGALTDHGEISPDTTAKLLHDITSARTPAIEPGSTQNKLDEKFQIEHPPAAASPFGGLSAQPLHRPISPPSPPPPAAPAESPHTTGRERQVLSLLAVAQKLIDMGQLAEARVQVNAILGLDGTNSAARQLEAQIQQHDGIDREQAVRRADALRAAETKIAELLEAGDLLEAEVRLYAAEESLGEQPSLRRLAERLSELQDRARDSRVQRFLDSAREHERRGDLDAALRDLQLARQVDPIHPEIAVEVTRLEAAIREAQLELSRSAAVAEVRRHAEAALARGDLAEARRELASGLATFGAVEALEPLAARLAEALAAREEEREEARKHAQVEVMLEQVYELLNAQRFDSALRMLREAAELDPRDEEIATLLPEVAERVAASRRDLDVRMAAAQAVVRVESLLQRGDAAGARKVLAEATSQLGEAADLREARVRLAAFERELEERERRSEVEALLNRAYGLFNRNLYPEAESCLTAAAKLDPENLEVATMLAQARELAQAARGADLDDTAHALILPDLDKIRRSEGH